MEPKPTQIIEALLFAADHPLTAEEIAAALPEEASIPDLIDDLNRFYETSGRAFRIREVAGGYQLATRPEFAPHVNSLFAGTRAQKLSRAGLETLSIVAYKQPVIKAEIERIRGVQSDGVLKTLLERDLVAICGRQEGPGRPLLYGTTDKFLEYFGLKDLSGLPTPDELGTLLSRQKLTELPATSPELELTLTSDASATNGDPVAADNAHAPESDTS